MDGEELRLIDLNLVESIRELARWEDGAELLERGGIAAVSGRGFLLNTALRTDPLLPAEQFCSRAAEFFAARDSAFTLCTRDFLDPDVEVLARERGLRSLAHTPWMILRKPLPAGRARRGLDLERATQPRDIAELAEIEADAYTDLGFRADDCRALFATPRRLLLPHLLIHIARVEGAPAAAALALLSHGVAGLYWVGTQRQHRRAGLAEACTRAAANDAFAHGARFVALHASPMGEPLYRRMGFEAVAAHRWFWVASPAQLR